MASRPAPENRDLVVHIVHADTKRLHVLGVVPEMGRSDTRIREVFPRAAE